MIYHEVAQQSPEWFRMRLGLATASCFDKIITPKTAEPSKSMDDYANSLIGELITGESSEKFQSYWMERGAQMEAEASASYEVITDFTLDRGGFLTDDNMTVGASPDRRVLKLGSVVGGVEIKCPKPETHIANLLRKGEIDPSYKPQVQGQILIGEFEFVDWFSYHPDMPPAHIRTYRDDAYCEKLKRALDAFTGLMDEKISVLTNIGVIIPERPIVQMYREQMNFEQENLPNYLMAG